MTLCNLIRGNWHKLAFILYVLNIYTHSIKITLLCVCKIYILCHHMTFLHVKTYQSVSSFAITGNSLRYNMQ